MKNVKKLITELSGHRGMDCYYVLCCAVEAAIAHQPDEVKMKQICFEIMETSGKKYKTVSKAISRAVNDIWEYGNRDKLFEIYGHSLIEKPSPKDLICVLSQFIWLNPDKL